MDQNKWKKFIFPDEKEIVWNVNIKAYDSLILLKSCEATAFKLMKFKIVLN